MASQDVLFSLFFWKIVYAIVYVIEVEQEGIESVQAQIDSMLV